MAKGVDEVEAASERLGADFSSLERGFEEDFDAIYRYAYHRVGLSSAEEVAAETFARAVVRWDSFDPNLGPLRSWLFGIAANICREHDRARTTVASRRFVGFEPVLDSIEPMIERLGDTARVAAALARLRPDAQEVLLLVGGFEFTYEDAARVLAIPVGTVRSRLSKARRAFVRAFVRVEAVDPEKGRAAL